MTSPTHNACNVCLALLGTALYRSIDGQSLTSLCRPHPSTTEVYSCASCGHLQTLAIEDVEAFYDHEYDILTDSDEEDQIYEMRDGTPVYRTAHQVQVLRNTLGDVTTPLMLLDYGCAKSSTIRTLCTQEPNIVPHLYDVSTRYKPFWSKFSSPDSWAIKHTPDAWQARFDMVTSFFSLEHIPEIGATMRHIASLIRPGGRFYAVVPNVLTNVADFVVIDHCNHFTAPSITRLLADAGLTIESIDDTLHHGAFIIVARKPECHLSTSIPGLHAAAERVCGELSRISTFWNDAAERVRTFESSLPENAEVAIYGAGFYGAFLRSSLANPGRVACHLDNNPFLHEKPFNHKPVLPPTQLPASIDAVLVGLNPAHARRIIADIPTLTHPDLKLFFL